MLIETTNSVILNQNRDIYYSYISNISNKLAVMHNLINCQLINHAIILIVTVL